MFGNNPFNEYRATQKQVQEKKAIDAESIDGSTVTDVDASIQEAKFVIPEEIPANEKNAFMGAAAAARKAGNTHFSFAGKKYKATMSGDTANAIADQKEGAMDFSKGAFKRAATRDKFGKQQADMRARQAGFANAQAMGDAKRAERNKKLKHGDYHQEGYMKDIDTEKSEPTPRSDAKVKSDFKKRRKTDVDMNPQLDKGTKDNSMEQKESRIRTALKSILEGDRAKHYKGATKPETMDDKLSGKGAKDMMNQPINRDDTEEKGHQDASKANRVGPSAKPRSSGDNLKNGDKKIIPSATPVKDPKGAGSAEVKAESFDKMAGIKAAYAEMYAPKVEEEIEESYTHEFDYAEDGAHTAKKFVATAKKAGIKAKIHTMSGPGGGHPVVHLGHKDTKVMHKFLKKHYDSDIEHSDLDDHKI